jgi:homoserine dehydrogenase
MERKNLNIGLFGFGCVGYGLYEVLHKTPSLNAQISKICVKNKDKQRPISANHFTFDKNDILLNDSINVVVELIDDADAAFEIVSKAIKSGKAVVTANKKMIAEHFEELLLLQQQYGVPLLYEAACCASIPIIRNLEEYYDNDLLESVEGIVNGSTNYILTKTFAESVSYADALLDAQNKGYAESNPTLDTGGFDAKYKLQILLAHAFGLKTIPADIFNYGIDNIGELELTYAREKGLKIKLVAQAFKTADNKVAAFVLPKFVDEKSKLYHVDDVFNGIVTQTCFADTQFFVGKGAGAYPTASAVISDISALSYNYKYEYKKLKQQHEIALDNNVLLHVFLRHNKEHALLLSTYFVSVNESYTNNENGYISGVISLENLQKITSTFKTNTSVILHNVVFNDRDEENKNDYAVNKNIDNKVFTN